MHLLCVCSIFRDSMATRDWLVILTEASTYGVLVLVISLTLYPLQLFDTHGSSQWGLILVYTNYKRIFTPLYLSLLSVCFIFCYNSLLCLCVFLFIVSPFRTLEVVLRVHFSISCYGSNLNYIFYKIPCNVLIS